MASNDETSDKNDTLMKLSDMGETIKLGDEDIRSYTVRDKDGNDIGKVHDLLIDPRGNTVRFLVVESGGFLGMGERKSFIPVDAITQITMNEVHIDQSRERVAGAPPYDPELVTTRTYHQDSYGYYGYTPYWVAGDTYPGFPFKVSLFGSESAPRPDAERSP
ncbi:PRC-barrel domain-containing protein [Arthrobacter sp. LAPM80]|uniref:PRC-barrel domain-containing protein n=1 Tax=Arthrobacter sp. LAPM80 TaxID=3141788 RepID=UPI00398BA710